MSISEKDSEDKYSIRDDEDHSISGIKLNKNEVSDNSVIKPNKDEDEDQKSDSSSVSSDSSSSSDEENMEFTHKVVLLNSDSTKSTEKAKKHDNFYKGFKRKPSRSIDEDFTVNQLAKKTNEYFDTSPKKPSLFRARTFNRKDKNYNNNSNSINISNNESVNKSTGRRRLSLLMLGEEKSKVPSRRDSIFKIKREPVVKDEKPVRYDNNGTVICKKNKRKVRITFAFPFENVVEIESFKGMNYVSGLPKEYVPQQQHTNCQCCTIY